MNSNTLFDDDDDYDDVEAKWLIVLNSFDQFV